MQVPELQIQEVPYHIANEEILREWQMTMIDNRRLSVDDPFASIFFGAQYARHAVGFVQVYSMCLLCSFFVLQQLLLSSAIGISRDNNNTNHTI